jgi:hypothetical protein
VGVSTEVAFVGGPLDGQHRAVENASLFIEVAITRFDLMGPLTADTVLTPNPLDGTPELVLPIDCGRYSRATTVSAPAFGAVRAYYEWDGIVREIR